MQLHMPGYALRTEGLDAVRGFADVGYGVLGVGWAWDRDETCGRGWGYGGGLGPVAADGCFGLEHFFELFWVISLGLL